MVVGIVTVFFALTMLVAVITVMTKLLSLGNGTAATAYWPGSHLPLTPYTRPAELRYAARNRPRPGPEPHVHGKSCVSSAVS